MGMREMMGRRWRKVVTCEGRARKGIRVGLLIAKQWCGTQPEEKADHAEMACNTQCGQNQMIQM